MSIVEDTERTRFCPQTDRRTRWNQYTPSFNFVEAGGIMMIILLTHICVTQYQWVTDVNIPSTVKDTSAHFPVCRNPSRSFSPISELCWSLMLGLRSVSPFVTLRQNVSNKWILHSWLRLINWVISSCSSSPFNPGRPKRTTICCWQIHMIEVKKYSIVW